MFRILIRNFAGNSEHLQKIMSQIKSNPIIVYSKTICPYCSAAKSMLAEMNVNPKVIEIDVENDGKAIFSAVKELTMQNTVPNIFIAGSHIGGFSDLKAGLESGAVQIKLKEAKIQFKDIN